MVSSRSDDKTEELEYPILTEVKKRFKNSSIDTLCYPVGLAAYFTDRIIYHDHDITDLIDHIYGKGYDLNLAVSIDSLVASKFYLYLHSEIESGTIYDPDTFFEFMQGNSPEAIQLGITGKFPRGRFSPAKNIIPRDMSL